MKRAPALSIIKVATPLAGGGREGRGRERPAGREGGREEGGGREQEREGRRGQKDVNVGKGIKKELWEGESDSEGGGGRKRSRGEGGRKEEQPFLPKKKRKKNDLASLSSTFGFAPDRHRSYIWGHPHRCRL